MRPSTTSVPRPVDPLTAADRRDYFRSSQRYRAVIRTEEIDGTSVVLPCTLINVSLGGALVSADAYVPRDRPCSLEIPDAVGRIVPHQMVGRIVATSVAPRSGYLSRIEFAEPLETIKEPGKM